MLKVFFILLCSHWPIDYACCISYDVSYLFIMLMLIILRCTWFFIIFFGYEWMNEWMMHLYSAFCGLLYTQSDLQSCGGGGLSSTTTSVQHPLGWCDGCHRTMAPVLSPHTSYRWRGEREIEPIKWMGIIRRPWLTRASGGNLAWTPGLHPYSLREVPWDF